MEFKISRTSNWTGKPLGKAVKKEVFSFDFRTASVEGMKSVDESFSSEKNGWSKPIDIDYKEAKSVRWKKEMIWCISINALEDLMKLYANEGIIIIRQSCTNGLTGNWKEIMPEIEIYDTYRE